MIHTRKTPNSISSFSWKASRVLLFLFIISVFLNIILISSLFDYLESSKLVISEFILLISNSSSNTLIIFVLFHVILLFLAYTSGIMSSVEPGSDHCDEFSKRRGACRRPQSEFLEKIRNSEGKYLAHNKFANESSGKLAMKLVEENEEHDFENRKQEFWEDQETGDEVYTSIEELKLFLTYSSGFMSSAELGSDHCDEFSKRGAAYKRPQSEFREKIRISEGKCPLAHKKFTNESSGKLAIKHVEEKEEDDFENRKQGFWEDQETGDEVYMSIEELNRSSEDFIKRMKESIRYALSV